MKKLISLLLVVGVLVMGLTGVALAEEEEHQFGALPLPYYMPLRGTVISVDESDDLVIVKVEDENGSPAHFTVTDRTYFPFESEIAEGDEIVAYYQADRPVPAIWPPIYTADVIVAGVPEGQNAQVDRFHEWEDGSEGYLIGRGRTFAFRVDESTEIITADGLEYDGVIEGRRLVVIYDVSTRSFPELATAKKVIALFEDAVHLPGLVQQGSPNVIVSAPAGPILVNGSPIVSPEAFTADDGETLMVPLRAIAEALGYIVGWDGAARAVTLGDDISFVIGQNSYLIGGETVILDGAPAPVIVDGATFVPLRFFTEIAV